MSLSAVDARSTRADRRPYLTADIVACPAPNTTNDLYPGTHEVAPALT